MILVSATLFCLVAAAAMLISGFRGSWHSITEAHFASVIGLPSGAILALAIVLLLRHVSGDIELKISGFEFKGGTAPIVMWIGCFLAIALAVRMTWNLEAK